MKVERGELIQKLKNQSFDILVIGGGATGSGIAYDAALRGLRVALVDSGDFSGQTSSKSTKLLHGGIRYLEKAFKEFDFSQFSLVKAGLEERSTVLKIAPHLSRSLPIIIPVYSKFQACYYWAGIKVYELLSGKHTIGKSRYISKKDVLHYFPKIDCKKMKGAILYFDGQFDDARLNVSLALSTIYQGGVAANYVKVIDFEYVDGKVVGALVEDQESQQTWSVKAKAFVNATGPFSDQIRKLDNPSVPRTMVGSIGTHIIINHEFSPKQVGVLIPKTSDGRVLFLLPWERHTLVGTTDIPVNIAPDPEPSNEEVDYLLEHLRKYLGIQVTTDDVLAKWSGIRPLVSEGNGKKTAKLSRDFVVERSASGLYSILGGKWTSYRKMGEKLLDRMISDEALVKCYDCQTTFSPVIGGDPPWEGLEDSLLEFDQDIQDHLYQAYGTRSIDVAHLAKERNLEGRLHPSHPFIEAEVVWAVLEEMAIHPDDVLQRRVRLMMVDQKAAEEVRDRVAQLMEQAHAIEMEKR